MPKLNNLKICRVPLQPSANEHSIIHNLFIWRTEKKFVGENRIDIMDIKEPIWWNRPYTSDVFCKLEDDGLYSYNLPIASGENSFKTKYNYLLNKQSIPIVLHIQLDDTWTDDDKYVLSRMCQTCVYEALLDLGVSKEDLSVPKNDLLFQGRKFVGIEQASADNVHSEALCVTLAVSSEEDIFARLTGQYARKRPITGISEEVPSVTKEAFIERLIERLHAYIGEHFN